MMTKEQGRRPKGRRFNTKWSKNGEKWRKEGPSENGPNRVGINDLEKLENGKFMKNDDFG